MGCWSLVAGWSLIVEGGSRPRFTSNLQIAVGDRSYNNQHAGGLNCRRGLLTPIYL